MRFALAILCALLAVNFSSSAPWEMPGWIKDAGNWVDKAAKDTGKWVEGAAKDTDKWVKGAAKDTENWVKGAARDTDQWVKGAAKDTDRWVKGAARDTDQWVKGAAKDTENWVKGAARDTDQWVKGAAKDTEKWVKGAARDVEKAWKDVANSVTDFFNRAGEEINKAVNSVKNEWNKFEKNASNFFKNAQAEVKKHIEDIKKRIEETGDSIVKVIYDKIYELLQSARAKLEDYSEVADAKFEKAMEKVRQKLFTSTSQIEGFLTRMKGILEKKQDKGKGMDILEKYTRESSEKIESCADAAIEPIRDLYEASKSFINSAIERLDDVIRDMGVCLDKGVSKAAVDCGKNLRKSAKAALKELGSELIGMKATLISSAVSEVVNFVCIGKTRAEVEFAKANIEAQIKALK